MLTLDDAKSITKEFLDDVKSRGISINQAYLFGSIVKGTNNKDSDIDVAIVSDEFTGFLFDDRKKINHSILKVNSDLEVHPFVLYDFNIDNPFAKEIISTGIRVA